MGSPTVTSLQRTLEVGRPFDLARTLGALADGRLDPTWRIDQFASSTRAVHAQWTPEGPATLEVLHATDPSGGDGPLRTSCAGPGAEWLSGRLEWICGLHDDPRVPNADLHQAVRRSLAAARGLHIARASGLLGVIAPTVLGQRVTKAEAQHSFVDLVHRHGAAAPGTDEVMLPPDAATMLRMGDADWHAIGVERRRADAVRVLLRHQKALERAGRIGEPGPPSQSVTAEFRRVAESLPGIGPWTSTSLASVLLGDPDVVVLGDLHLPNGISWALASEPRGDDRRMLELLEPFRPQRGRVARLLKATGSAGAPRRGPRHTPLPVRDM